MIITNFWQILNIQKRFWSWYLFDFQCRSLNLYSMFIHILRGPPWLWSYGSWIYNYLFNQCLSPLILWVQISSREKCTTLCDKVCQWLVTGRWFSPGPSVSSTNKTYCQDITEILLKVAINIIKQTNKHTILKISTLLFKLELVDLLVTCYPLYINLPWSFLSHVTHCISMYPDHFCIWMSFCSLCGWNKTVLILKLPVCLEIVLYQLLFFLNWPCRNFY